MAKSKQQETSHSPRYATVKKWYDLGKWPESVVRTAVDKGWITKEECDEILGGAEE